MEILMQSENLRLGVRSYRSPEENNSENIRSCINLSGKGIFEKPNKKNLSRPEKYGPSNENETDISK